MAYKSINSLYAELDLLPKLVDPLTDAAYEFVLQRKWQNDEGNSPHGHPWHTSFHASQFPANKDFACPRKAVYQMANFQTESAPNRKLVGQGEMGKAIEVAVTEKWEQFGILLSPPPTSEFQLGAKDEESWLTCSFDSVILPPGTNRPVPVEVKSKALERVREMILGTKGPDEQHVAQLKVQLYFLAKHQEEWWPNLEPVEFGVIYYLSRDDPSVTKEFMVPLDKEWVEERIDILKLWKSNFLSKTIEQRQEKSHPLGWKWSEPPCKWCEMKRSVCKPDFKSGIVNLAESHGVERTRSVRGNYDFSETRQTVIDRWKNTSEE